jgi:hypothetical protein
MLSIQTADPYAACLQNSRFCKFRGRLDLAKTWEIAASACGGPGNQINSVPFVSSCKIVVQWWHEVEQWL